MLISIKVLFVLPFVFSFWRSEIFYFAKFFQAESAIAALSCSGVILGSLPIRLD